MKTSVSSAGRRLRTHSTATRRRTMARPKQTVAFDRDPRSIKRVKTCSNGRSEPDSIGTCSHEEDEPSIETSDPGELRETWLEDAPQNEEVNKAACAETMSPSLEEEEDCVIVKSVAGSRTEYLPTKATNVGSGQGLKNGQVESAPTPPPASASEDFNFTGIPKGSNSAPGFDCTTCGKNFSSTWDIQEHPSLGVGICRGCRNFLFSSPYTKDRGDGSEEQCRWCGEGGRIVMCDSCPKVFCEACIVRNFSKKELDDIVNSYRWNCFRCYPERLRVHVNKFKEFKNSVPSENCLPVRERGASSAGKSCATRNASNIPGMTDPNATIRDLLVQEEVSDTFAELCAQDEERRKLNPEEWMKPRGKPGRKPGIALKAHACRTKDGTSQKVLQQHTAHAQALRPTKTNRQSTKSTATTADMAKQAAVPSEPPAKTYIRPHQWIEKRQQAAERRKQLAEEAAEAERLNKVINLSPNDDLKNDENDSKTQAADGAGFSQSHRNQEDKEVHPRHRREETGNLQNDNGKLQVKPEQLPDLHVNPSAPKLFSDVAVGNEAKVKETIVLSEENSGDMMQTYDDAFANPAKNLFADFTGVFKQ